MTIRALNLIWYRAGMITLTAGRNEFSEVNQRYSGERNKELVF
jgi:hypothetical protein